MCLLGEDAVYVFGVHQSRTSAHWNRAQRMSLDIDSKGKSKEWLEGRLEDPGVFH